MTSEAHPAVSVRVRAREIEARTRAAGGGPPVASQVPSTSPDECFRLSRGALQKRVGDAPLLIVRAKSEGSSSGGLASAALCQTETSSKFAPFSGGEKRVVTCHKRVTSDFSPAIFSTTRLLPTSSVPSKQSPLDDIITALEKICDEFDLPEGKYSTPQQSFQRECDGIVEKGIHVVKWNDSASDETQWLSEHSLPQLDPSQEIGNDSVRKSFESIPSSSLRSGKQYPTSLHNCYESEPIICRLTVESQQRHASASLRVSPPKIPGRSDFKCRPSTSTDDSKSRCTSIEKSPNNDNTTVVLERVQDKCGFAADSKFLCTDSVSSRKSFPKKESSSKNSNTRDQSLTPTTTVLHITCENSIQSVYASDEKARSAPAGTCVELKAASFGSRCSPKVRPPAVAIKPEIPSVLSRSSSTRAQIEHQQTFVVDDSSPSEELETVKSILANLDFQKYKRRHSLDSMEPKSPKPSRAQKSSSVKLKDFFEILKPNLEVSSGSNKKPLTLCRSSSFSNAEPAVPDRSATFFLQNAERDGVSPLPEVATKMSTLPRQKSPSRPSFMKVSSPPPLPAVASCPSIVKLESHPIPFSSDPAESDGAQGVSDSEVGPSACVTSCVSSGPRGHVRSASDTAPPSTQEVGITKAEKFWISRFSGSEKRKRRKGIGCDRPSIQDNVKSGSDRSLTYPPQRKGSVSDGDQEFTSVDSNGLKSLKLLTMGLMDSRPNVDRLLSDWSLADSHSCRSEEGMDDTYLDGVDSRFHFPDTDPNPQRVSVDQSQSSKSPQEQRRYSKRRLRGPYGEMLEEEMRKSGEKQKAAYSDLNFLQDLCESKRTAQDDVASQSQSSRPAMFLSSQSLDEESSTPSKSDLVMCGIPKRKISANYPLLSDGETAAIASDEDITPTKPNEALINCDPNNDGINRDACIRKPKEDQVPGKVHDQFSDTRTHVVGELYDTEKSYVESLQILSNKYMKPLKSPEYSGIVEAGLVDEIFYQIPEILSHHEGFLELLRQRIVNWDSKQKVGDVFVEAFTKKNVSETYTAFINNWKSAKEAIKLAIQAKPAFSRFLEHMSREHKGKLTLDALLIMPVQRIPRYELLIKELLKHTHIDHPDHHPLVEAQKEVHDLALKINRMEREAFQLEQMQQRVREIEQLIDGVIDLAQPDRDFIRHDIVTMPGGLGAKKERCLFLFSDVLLITSMKRKSTTMRKPSSTSSLAQSALSCLEMNKYKLLTKFSLDNLDIAKNTDSVLKKLLKDIENLEQDVALLNQISQLVTKLNNHNQVLEDTVKDVMNGMTKQLNEKQNVDSHLVSLELSVTTQESIDNLTIQFSTPEKRSVWEAAFNEAKQKLALSTDRRPPPEFMHPLPIRKTRAGLQFTCATATLGLNQQSLRDVWVCNSDGYVGQVCVLSLMPEPTVMSCNGVCNARILTIASIPAACGVHAEKNRWRPNLPDNVSGVSVEVEEVDEECDEERINNGNIQLDSDSSDEDDDTESTDDEKVKEETRKRGNSIPHDECQEDMDNKQPTMWLGTEDGCIHVYNCNDNIRTKKNKIKIQLSAAILCIIYLDNRVFVSVANGEIHVYRKDPNGGWCTSESQKIIVGSSAAPVTRILAVAGKLWCGCQNTINILNTGSLQVEHSFAVSSDSSRTVFCMATSGLGVWITLHHSAILRLFHATSYECLFDLNVAPAVTKMLAGCDDIIRQHKAACLRVTALLACKDLLWIGTSAGVILTLPLPHLTSATTTLDNLSNVSGLPYGHTGHVRFLTCVEMTPSTSLDSAGYNKYALRSLRGKEGTSGRRASTSASAVSKLLVISGGDGYEDFQNSGLGEAAGRDDSTNHLLLWQV